MNNIEFTIMMKKAVRKAVREKYVSVSNDKMSDKAQAFINEIKRDQKTDALTAKMSIETILRYAREQVKGREIKANDVMYGFIQEKNEWKRGK